VPPLKRRGQVNPETAWDTGFRVVEEVSDLVHGATMERRILLQVQICYSGVNIRDLAVA